jgi:hypothetical protein
MPKYYDNHVCRSRNIYIPRKFENHSVDSANSDNSYLLNTINNMLVRMNELDQSNKKKENRINELEHLINKGNGNNNYTMAKKPRGLIEDDSHAQWFVDGQAAFEVIASSIEDAKSEVCFFSAITLKATFMITYLYQNRQ